MNIGALSQGVKVCVWLPKVLSSIIFFSLFFSRIKMGVSYLPLPLEGAGGKESGTGTGGAGGKGT